MPFTTSHPAVVLLLKNAFPKHVSLTGLIAGAMSPDLLYFLEMNTVNRGLSHSWDGLFLVSLPLGLLFSFVFHFLFKKELITHLPNRMMKHFSGLAYSEWKVTSMYGWIVLIVSVLIGGLSHFGWDSCTHLDGEVVQFFPILQDNIYLLDGSFRVFRMMQFLSTIFGAAAIVIYFSYSSNLPKRVEILNVPPVIYKISFWVITTLFSALFAYIVLHLYMYYAPEKVISARTIFGLAGWSGFFYLTIGLGLYKRFKK